jgi:transcriptional regulator with XRE-family HTH domain
MSEQTKNNVLSGAKLRAKRELVGLTVEELANECGCDWRDVRSLEEPWRGVEVSDDVVVAVGVCLDELQERMRATLDYAVSVYEEFADIAREDPLPIVLPYYRDQAEFDKHSRDKGCYSFANAVTRVCLAAFDGFGVPTRLYYPAEESRTVGGVE